jgi:hypothetical protein
MPQGHNASYTDDFASRKPANFRAADEKVISTGEFKDRMAE